MRPNSTIFNSVFITGKNALRVSDSGFYVEDIAEDTNITYVGKKDKDGHWQILKIDESNGTTFRVATESNNPGLDYAAAWDQRASLNYGRPSEVL